MKKQKEEGVKETPSGIWQQEFYPMKNIKYFVTA